MTHYPNYPGHRGQDTSKLAAEAFSDRQESIRARCFAAIQEAGTKGLTTAEVEDKLGRTLAQRPFDPRISELVEKVLVMDSGQRRMGRCGVPIKVWIAVPNRPGAIALPSDDDNSCPLRDVTPAVS